MIFVREAWNVKKSAFGTDRSTEERRKSRKWGERGQATGWHDKEEKDREEKERTRKRIQ